MGPDRFLSYGVVSVARVNHFRLGHVETVGMRPRWDGTGRTEQGAVAIMQRMKRLLNERQPPADGHPVGGRKTGTPPGSNGPAKRFRSSTVGGDLDADADYVGRRSRSHGPGRFARRRRRSGPLPTSDGCDPVTQTAPKSWLWHVGLRTPVGGSDTPLV